MEVRIEKKSDFVVHGYAVETILSSSEHDVGQLWAEYKDVLLAMSERHLSLYGVMWYTQDHKYFYLLGIKNDMPSKRDMISVEIPAADFAIATVPSNMTEIEAWTQYFDNELPALGYSPDAEHGKYFKLHNANGVCELWTPVKKQVM